MPIKSFYYSLLICFLIAFSTIAQGEQTINLALIADKASGLDASPLLSLLEVELSHKEDIQLLERAAIDKILEEQKLSAAGLLDRNTTIKIGKLLRADAFIILSLENPVPERSRVNQMQDANDLIRVRVSETAHGLRLLDSFEQSNSKNPQEAVKSIIQKIENVLTKINQPDEKLIPVGIVDIHRVQLGEQYKMLERTLPTMLSVRLSLEPQIIMLEREDLKVLLDENLMTKGEDSEFWSSAVLIDGYIQPNNGQLELHLNIKQAAGDSLKSIIVPIEPNEAVAAIDKASTDIIKEIQNSPPVAKWNPEKEAEQFYNKAQMLIAHGRNDEALPLFETAHALQPQNIYYTGNMFERVWDKYKENKEIEKNNNVILTKISETKNTQIIGRLSNRLVEPSVHQYTDLELAEMVSVLVRQIRDNYEKGKLTSQDIYEHFSEYLGKTFGYQYYFSNYASVATQQIKMINQENREIYCETFRKAISNQLIDPKRPETNYIALTNLAWISTDDPNIIITNIKSSFFKYIMSPELGGTINSFKERENIFKGGFFINKPILTSWAMSRSHLKVVSKDFYKLWFHFVLELTNINDLLLSSKGALLLFQEFSNLPNESDKISAKNLILNITESLTDELTNSKSSLDNAEKEIALSYIIQIIQYSDIIDTENKTIIIDKLCNYLIELNDINSLVDIVTHLPSLDSTTANTTEIDHWRYQLLKKISILFKINDTDTRVKRASKIINDTLEEFNSKYSESNTSSQKTNFHVTILMNDKRWEELGWGELDYIYEPEGVQAKVQGNMLWVTLFTSFGRDVQDDNGNSFSLTDVIVSGIDLEQKQEKIKWLTSVLAQHKAINTSKDLIIGKKNSYLTIEYGGILQFPGNDFIEQDTLKNPKFLNHKNGLPSFNITSIAQYGDKLLVAYGDSKKESGLGIYDPNTEEWETIFCSTLQGEPPFSSGQTYQITSILYTNPDKLFLIVSGLNKSEPWVSQLWKVNLNTHESNYMRILGGEFLADTNNTWIKSSGKLIIFDPVSESMKLTIRTSIDFYRRYPKNLPNISGLNEDLFLPETFLKKVNVGSLRTEGDIDLTTGTIYNNKLWSRFGKRKIIIAEKGSNFEDTQIIDNNILNGKPVYKFVNTPYGLVAIGDGIVGLIETGN